jgi:hypothetical protein
MASTLCIHLDTHFVRMPSCFIVFILPFSAVAPAPLRLSLIGAMNNHRSVLGSYRSAVLNITSSSVPPITYSTSPNTATQWLILERKIIYFVMCFMFHWFWCSFVVDTDRFFFTEGNCTFVTVESQFKVAVKQTWRSCEWKHWSESVVSEQGPTAM